MIPILYDKSTSNFANNGIGFLSEAVSCTVTEERNGAYEAALQYPVNGLHFAALEKGAIIKAKPNDTAEPQLFRVYKIGKAIGGVASYNAEHISYALNGNPVAAVTSSGVSAQAAMQAALNAALMPHSFSAWSDISTKNTQTITEPRSVRACFGGQEGSVLDIWGGEFEFDNFTVKLHAARGKNNGVTIAYGKNLTDLQQEENITDCYTHLFPYAKTGAGNIIMLTEKIYALNGANIGHTRCLTIDLSQDFGEDETVNEASLRVKVNAFVAKNKPGMPKVNIKAAFAQLWKTPEYEGIAPLEQVHLCDDVTVHFAQLGVDATAKVIKTVYDSILERYASIELGDAKSRFGGTT